MPRGKGGCDVSGSRQEKLQDFSNEKKEYPAQKRRGNVKKIRKYAGRSRPKNGKDRKRIRRNWCWLPEMVIVQLKAVKDPSDGVQ